MIHRTVGSGGSFGGNPLRQEIGLGKAKRVAWLEVLWPATGETQRVTGLRPGHRYRIREGSARAERGRLAQGHGRARQAGWRRANRRYFGARTFRT